MRNTYTIEANGISICYQDSGEGSSPVIFIHGFPFNKSTWEEQYDALKEKYRVIIYDLRGFGGSAAGNEKASIALFANDLIAFMDALHINKAIVCGLSMGGYILLNAIERYPDRFKGIVLSDTQCLADSAENKEKRFDTIKEIEKNGLEAFSNSFVKNLFSKSTAENNPSLPEKIKKIILSNSSEAIMAALQAMAERKETCSGLSRIKVPALILCGEEDTLTPPSLSEFLFNHIDGARLHILKGAGHLSNLEKSSGFNKHLLDFIG